ncbi:MAG: hypothetical protein WCO86_15090, partial [Planctomycetota bacterium]
MQADVLTAQSLCINPISFANNKRHGLGFCFDELLALDDFVPAILIVPETEKSRTQILGRYSSSLATAQCLKPPEVIEELLSIVFRIEQLAWVCSIAAGVVTCLLLGLVVNLSMRLRESEMQTMFRLGCSRTTIAMLHGSEI